MARITREPDVSGEIRQAGGIVFRNEDGRREFLVITTKDRRSWIFPKGHVEAGEDDAEAALREVLEESGVTGVVVATLDPPHRFRSAGEETVVRYVLVCALSDGNPEEGRDKRWVSADEALVLLAHPEARRLVVTANQLLEQAPLGGGRTGPTDLARAEYDHRSRSLVENERRAQHGGWLSILLLVCAVATPDTLRTVALGVALVLGLSELRKVLDDTRVRHGHRRAMAASGRGVVEPTPSFVGALSRGGALPTVLVVDGVLAGGLGAAVFELPLQGAMAVAGVVVLVLIGLAYREYPRG